MSHTIRKKISDYFLDVSKLVFGGMVLSTVLQLEGFPKIGILVAGIIATVLIAILGFLLLKE